MASIKPTTPQKVPRKPSAVSSQAADSENRFEALLESAPDAIVIVDGQGKIVLVNSQAEKLFGYLPPELIGQDIELLVPSRLRSQHRSHRSRYQSEPQLRPMGSGEELYGRRKDGSEFPVEISLSPMMTVDGLLVTSVIRDVSESRRVQKELKKLNDELEERVEERTLKLNKTNQELKREILERRFAEAELQALASREKVVAEIGRHALKGAELQKLMDEAVQLTAQSLDVELCKILELLPEGQTFLLRAGLGWKKGLVGHALVEVESGSQAGYTLWSNGPVIVDDLRTEKRFQASGLLKKHKVISGVSVVIPGKMRPFGVLGVHTRRQRVFNKPEVRLLESVANALANAFETHRLEVERSQVTARLFQAEKMAEIGELAAGIAHEIRNPLAGIRGAIEILKDQCSDHITEEQIMGEILGRVDHLDAVIRDLLEYAKPKVANKIPVRLATLLEDVLTTLNHDPKLKEVEILRNFDSATTISLDPDLMQRVFLNVILNAAQAMDFSGRITISAGAVDGQATISFGDSGPGIEAGILDKIFNPFFTTKRWGSGLGLSLCKKYLSAQSGSIEVSSRSGEGTVFTLCLPLKNGG